MSQAPSDSDAVRPGTVRLPAPASEGVDFPQAPPGSELKCDLLIIGLIFATCLFAMRMPRQPGIEIRDFASKEDLGAARFSFLVQNQTRQPMAVTITVRAEHAKDGHEGLQLWPLGVTNMVVTLRAHEERMMAGAIYVGSAGGATVFSKSLTARPVQAMPASGHPLSE